MPASSHEFVQLRFKIKILRCAPLEEKDGLLTMLGSHPQLLYEIFHMQNLILGNTSVGFGKLSHQDKNCFNEYGLPMSIRERIDSTRAVGNVSVDDASSDIAEQSAENTKKVKTY
jgi:hypothetical protein